MIMSRGWRILAFAAVIRLLLLIAVPLEENDSPFTISAFNDERAHYNYITALAKTGEVPIQTHHFYQSHPRGVYDFEYYQPPLSYKLAAVFYNILPEPAKGLRAMRGFNIILGCLTLFTIGRVLMMCNPAWGWAGMGFLAVFASHARFSATVTNDNLLWLLTALTAYFGLRVIKTNEWGDRLGLTLCVSAAIWTKLSGTILLPALLFAMFISYRGRKFILRTAYSVLWAVICLVLAAPVFLTNIQRYGKAFPMETGLGPAYNILTGWSVKKIYLILNYITHSFYFPFENHWIGAVQAGVFLIMGIFTLIILYLALRRIKREWNIYPMEYKNQLTFLGLTLAAAVFGLLYMTARFHQSEARLTFTALPAVLLLLMIGLEELLGRRKWRLALAAVIFPAVPYLLFVI
ncbi:glycosyltransferase family 39 protein [bacterium]|nr:glycosyltransferase family 39 protein [bacterium]